MTVAPPPATWAEALAVAAGSAVGGLLRWRVQAWLNPAWSQGFPLGTLAVNVMGGLVIGGAMAWLAMVPDDLWRLLLVVGFLGGLTTFSSFTWESLALLHRGDWGLALAHTAAHMLAALAAAAAGHALVRHAFAA
jgi:CrcB protein